MTLPTNPKIPQLKEDVAQALHEVIVRNQVQMEILAKKEALGNEKMNKNALAGYSAQNAPGVMTQTPGETSGAVMKTDKTEALCKECGKVHKGYAKCMKSWTKSDVMEMAKGTEYEKYVKLSTSLNTPGSKMPEPGKDANPDPKAGKITSEKNLIKAGELNAQAKPAGGKPVPTATKTPKLAAPGPKLPGMTPVSGQGKLPPAPVNQPVMAMKPGPSVPPVGHTPQQLDQARNTVVTDKTGKVLPFVKKPAADDAQAAMDLKADKKAGGVGFLSNLLSRFHGKGKDTWESLRGAGPANLGRAVRTMGSRMAMSEPEMMKKSESDALKEAFDFAKTLEGLK